MVCLGLLILLGLYEAIALPYTCDELFIVYTMRIGADKSLKICNSHDAHPAIKKSCILLNRKIKISFRIWFILKGEMPPLFLERDKSVLDHHFPQELSVIELLF